MAAFHPTRRRLIAGTTLAAVAAVASPMPAAAQTARQPFAQWVDTFRHRAVKRGVSEATYRRVMNGLTPDTTVYAQDRSQPEFTEATWQYLNRRVSDWRIRTGRQRAVEQAFLFSRIERDYGVDRHTLLGLWGMESAFGDVITHPNHMRPVFPSLAALAWGEPRRRSYWEQELLNALIIVERGWARPEEMVGSWAGAMGHTQWMPEVWLNIGVDYDGDGRINPFTLGDALAGTARYLVSRGKFRRGEAWGAEVRLPPRFNTRLADRKTARSLDAWRKLGIATADGRAFPRLSTARLWLPMAGGPAFLLGQNFFAVRSYNPSFNYALAIVHLGDRISGAPGFVQNFPGGERILTLEEIQEVQRRLTAAGFNTGGVDGRVGLQTMRAVRAFQERAGIAPADGYAGLEVLGRLRRGI